MSGTIKFFHPEETFVYSIEKSFCKVVYLENQNCLVLEIESTEDLDHLDEDSLQNEYPKVLLNIDDFPINAENKKDLIGQELSMPDGSAEMEDEDGELIEILYTNLLVNEYDYELNDNTLSFSKDDKGKIKVLWKGVADDFTEESDNGIPFEVDCTFINRKIVVED